MLCGAEVSIPQMLNFAHTQRQAPANQATVCAFDTVRWASSSRASVCICLFFCGCQSHGLS